jgi:putative Mg2+ transporter-C (MgtC) family protein
MLSNSEMILRLALAAVLGSIVGIERERLQWAAGLRTHMLVSVGSCLFMIVSAFGFAEALQQQNVSLDPSRIAAQVVSGIGFLGAGTILFRGEIVKGLTTCCGRTCVRQRPLCCCVFHDSAAFDHSRWSEALRGALP